MSIEAIKKSFVNIKDPRVDRSKRHSLIDILTIGLCSIISGGESFNDMELYGNSKTTWLKGFLELKNGIPSHDTFRRVFSLVDPKEFEKAFFEWANSIVESVEGRQISVDGKALRSSARKRKSESPVHLVSAWCSENGGAILGQIKTEDKSNEITAIPSLIEAIDIKKAVVSIDAAGCQRNIAKKIVESDGDYLLALKGNQKSIFNEVKYYFKENIENNIPSRSADNFKDYWDDSKGREVRRRVWAIHDISSIESLKNWPGVRSVLVVENIRSEFRGDKVTAEFRYYLSSLDNPTGDLSDRLMRNHWHIENTLHWSLDVTFGEDRSRVVHENSIQNLGILRRISISLLKQETSKKISLRQKKLRCAYDDEYMLTVLLGLARLR